MEQKNNGQFQIEIGEDVAEGTYSNMAVISHSSSEFVIDFVRVLPGVAKAKVKSRIVMTPEHAKRLMYALQDNIRRYESQFDEINMPEQRGTFPTGGGFKGEA